MSCLFFGHFSSFISLAEATLGTLSGRPVILAHPSCSWGREVEKRGTLVTQSPSLSARGRPGEWGGHAGANADLYARGLGLGISVHEEDQPLPSITQPLGRSLGGEAFLSKVVRIQTVGSVWGQRRGRNTTGSPVISKEANAIPWGRLAKPIREESRASVTYNPTSNAETYAIKCSDNRIKAETSNLPVCLICVRQPPLLLPRAGAF